MQPHFCFLLWLYVGCFLSSCSSFFFLSLFPLTLKQATKVHTMPQTVSSKQLSLSITLDQISFGLMPSHSSPGECPLWKAEINSSAWCVSCLPPPSCLNNTSLNVRLCHSLWEHQVFCKGALSLDLQRWDHELRMVPWLQYLPLWDSP